MTIPLNRGLNTKTDEKLLKRGELSILENAVFTKAVALSKRYGTEAIPLEVDGGPIAAPRAITTRGDELVLLAQSKLYSYAESAARWYERGNIEPVAVSEETVAYRNSEQSVPDAAESAGIRVFAWEESAGVYASVAAADGGAILVPPTLIAASGADPRVVPLDDGLVILWSEAGSNEIKSLPVSPVSPATSLAASAVQVTTNLDGSNPWFDVVSKGPVAVLVWNVQTTNAQEVAYLLASGILGSPGTGYPAATSFSDSSSSDGIATALDPEGSIAIVNTNGTGVFARVVTPAFGTVASGTLHTGTDVVRVTCAFRQTQDSDDLYRLFGFWEENAVADVDHFIQWDWCTAEGSGAMITVNGSPLELRHSCLATQAFANGGYSFANVVHPSTNQPTLFCVRDDGTLVAKALANSSVGMRTNPMLASVNAGAFAHGFRFQLPVEVGNPRSYAERSIKLVSFDFDPADDYRTVQLGETLYITGGFLWAYDGHDAHEAGFHLVTEGITAQAQNSGGGLIESTYEWAFYWESFSAGGERELSSAFARVSVTLGAGEDQVQFTIPTLAHTNRPSGNVRLAAYRSVHEDGVPTTERYRVDDPTNPTLNDPTQDTITFTDSMADATAATRELDHELAEFAHAAPPAPEVIAQSEDRVFVAGFENPDLVKFSKVHEYTKGVAFSDGELELEVPPEGGPVTGLAPLDGRLLIFKESRIYELVGSGPSNTGIDATGGQVSPFRPARLVTTDVGCTNQRSIVESPKGVFFQTPKGIYLFARTGQVIYIGAKVEAFNDQGITAAWSLPNRNEVVFLTDAGNTLVYDHQFDEWSSWTDFTGIDATVWKGSLVYLRSDEVRRQVEGLYTDAGAFYPLKLRTGWIPLDNSPQGRVMVARLWALGSFQSAHLLQLRVAYDYEETWYEYSWDPPFEAQLYGIDTLFGEESFYGVGGNYGGLEPNVAYDLELQLWEKAKAIRFEIVDSLPLGEQPGEAYELAALAMQLIDQNTVPAHGADQQVG